MSRVIVNNQEQSRSLIVTFTASTGRLSRGRLVTIRSSSIVLLTVIHIRLDITEKKSGSSNSKRSSDFGLFDMSIFTFLSGTVIKFCPLAKHKSSSKFVQYANRWPINDYK